MTSERQRIETPTTPSLDNSMPPPPSYEEVNGVFASQAHNGSTDSMGYFLGEVSMILFLLSCTREHLQIINIESRLLLSSFVTSALLSGFISIFCCI